MKLFLIILVHFLLVACSYSIAKKDLYGKYSVEYDGSVETLEIFLDGTYKHTYMINNKVFSNTSTWEEQTLKNEKFGVTFKDFNFKSSDGNRKPSSYWHVELEKSFLGGSEKLCFDPDLYLCFIKSD